MKPRADYRGSGTAQRGGDRKVNAEETVSRRLRDDAQPLWLSILCGVIDHIVILVKRVPSRVVLTCPAFSDCR